MSTKKGLAAVVLAGAVAYPAAAWWLGGMIEGGHARQFEQMAAAPYLTIIERRYDRGVLNSTETVTMELSEAWTASLSGNQAGTGPLRLSVRSDIRHGPFPGFSSVAAGKADVHLILDEDTRAALQTLMGDQPPLVIETTYGFDGGGHATLSSPPFEFTATGSDGREGTLRWAGLRADIAFSRGMERYTLEAEIPGLEFAQQDGLIQVQGMRLQADQQRLFADRPMFYTGSMLFTAERLSLTPPNAASPDAGSPPAMEWSGLSYAVSMPVDGEFLDLVVKTQVNALKVAGQDYAPAYYDMSLRHLHARTASDLYDALMTAVYADEATRAATEADPSELFAALAEPAGALLTHTPVLAIDRLGFRSEHGETQFSIRAQFDGLQVEDLENPLSLLFKLDASGELSLPLGLIKAMQRADAESESEAAMIDAMLDEQVEALSAQGFIARNGDTISTKAVFKAGELTLNGKPFNPMAVMQ